MPPATAVADLKTDFSKYLKSCSSLDPFALRRAEQAQEKSGERLDVVLTRLGLVTEIEMAKVLAEFFGVTLINPGVLQGQPLLSDRIPPSFLSKNRILPISEEHGRLLVAVADPFDLDPVHALAFSLEQPVDWAIAVPRDIELALARLFAESATQDAGSSAKIDDDAGPRDEDIRRLQDLASDAPIIRQVQDIITRAVESNASDIHIEPREDCLEVRFRIDGHLHTIERLLPSLRAAVTSRLKIIGRLDIAERRLPQDGRSSVSVRGREIDLRISTMPTLNGESIVLRILDRASVPLNFASLGFTPSALQRLQKLISAPSGIVLVTGPTGSGKTTTLYTALSTLNDRQRKIFTVEDPIEYQLAGISQVHVEPRIGLGFAEALRSILRQDPDILMVGEIRDLETAQMAVQASLTGHLVLSTVHTNSAAATVARLINMGVEDYLLASSLTGVVAQRLVRRLCEACATPSEPSRALLDRLIRDAGPHLSATDLAPGMHRLRRKTGCPTCRGTGYAGRLSVSEILEVDSTMADALIERADERSIERVAVERGMCTMYQDGVIKALGGLTTIEEVLRATRGVA